MTVLRPLRTYFFLICGSLLCAYVVLEVGVRVSGLPQKSLIHDMDAELERAQDRLETHFPADPPAYGWDLPALIMPDAAPGANRLNMLFVGDSVTQGHSVDPLAEAYPSLLFKALNTKDNLRLINAAVPAFGVDQMILKFERMVVEYKPAIAVFAYIPHDLWRPGRDINNGVTKPVLFDIHDGHWRLEPAAATTDYYRKFLHAKNYFHMGPWALQHIADNARYYFPGSNLGYYRTLFRSIRQRLTTLAVRHDMEVLVVRLSSIWPGEAVPALDRLASEIFSPPAANYNFVDTEGCVKAAARTAGIDYDKEFAWHPGPDGHAIYARCLQGALAPLVLSRG